MWEASSRPSPVVGRRIIRLDRVDSTNSYARALAQQGEDEGLCVLSLEQTAGRGRRGRTFQSTRGLGLYLSVLLRPQTDPARAAHLTAWTGVAVCDAIRAVCGARAEIKWVNDLILNGKKVGGILTESVVEPDGTLAFTVVGVGINLSHRREEFDPELQHTATSLALELGRPVDREALVRQLLLELDRMYAGFPHEAPAVLERYRALCLTPGNPVRLITPAATREAVALDIDRDFRLLVRLDDGTLEAVATGEASVRGPEGYL